jgi:uncharacterized GH25 family protein
MSRPAFSSGTTEWNSPTQVSLASAGSMVIDGMSKATPQNKAETKAPAAKTEILVLAGQVSLDGQGVAKANIFAFPANSPVIQRIESNVGSSPEEFQGAAVTTKADDVGRFSLQVQQSGEWVVLALSEPAGPVAVKALAGSTDLQLRAPRSLGLSGRVVDSSGKAIPKALAVVVHSRTVTPDPAWSVDRKVAFTAFRKYAETDANGAFDLRGLDEGPFTLIVSAPEHAAAKLLEVRPGDEPKTVVLQAGATLAGVICDDQQRPVPNAAVATARVLPSGELDESDDISSDAKGGFASTHVAVGGLALVVKVVANGYASAQLRIAPLLPGERRQQSFVLEPATSLAVRIVGNGGAPVAGAMVEAYEASNQLFLQTLTTDAKGMVRFESASAARKYRVMAAAEGYGLGILPEATTKETCELTLPRSCAVEGTLSLEGGAPVAGTLQLRMESDRAEIAKTFDAVADANGKFRFESLELCEGIYTLVASAAGSAPAKQTAISVGPGVKTLRVVLPRGEVYQGRVVNRRGQPVAGVVVRAGETTPNGTKIRAQYQHHSAESDSTGSFRLVGVPTNAKFLVLSKNGTTPRVVRVLAEASGSSVLSVGDLLYEDGGSVAGKIIDKNGFPVSGATALLLGDDLIGDAAPAIASAADGTFRFPGVPGGTYAIDVIDPASVAVSKTPTRVTTEAIVRDGETTIITIDTRRFGRLYGQVRVRGAIPAADLEVVLRLPGARVGELAATRVSWSGSYELPVPAPGTYSLEVCSQEGPAIRAARTITVGAREERAIDLEIGDAQIVGIVRAKETGEAIPGAQVRIASGDGADWTVIADAKGRYQADGIPATNAWVSAISENHASLKATQVSFASSRSLVLDLELERRAELVVRAMASVGPIAGAKVSVWSEAGHLVDARTTNLQGEVAWDTLPAARYAISIEHAQYEGYRSATDVAAGQRTEASVDLKPTGTLVAVVKAKSGEAVANSDVYVTTSTGLHRWATSDAFGVVRFESVAEGRAVLSATGTAGATAIVRAGETAQATLEK